MRRLQVLTVSYLFYLTTTGVIFAEEKFDQRLLRVDAHARQLIKDKTDVSIGADWIFLVVTKKPPFGSDAAAWWARSLRLFGLIPMGKKKDAIFVQKSFFESVHDDIFEFTLLHEYGHLMQRWYGPKVPSSLTQPDLEEDFMQATAEAFAMLVLGEDQYLKSAAARFLAQRRFYSSETALLSPNGFSVGPRIPRYRLVPPTPEELAYAWGEKAKEVMPLILQQVRVARWNQSGTSLDRD